MTLGQFLTGLFLWAFAIWTLAMVWALWCWLMDKRRERAAARYARESRSRSLTDEDASWLEQLEVRW